MPATIISQFSIPGILIRSERFGSGLINDTFLCEFDDNGALRKYILQRINSSVFAHPEQVMQQCRGSDDAYCHSDCVLRAWSIPLHDARAHQHPERTIVLFR